MFQEPAAAGIDDDETEDAAGAQAALRLSLEVEDPEVVASLEAAPEGRRRNALALAALRIGVLALKQAQGQIDAERVRNEGERLIVELGAALKSHRETVASEINAALKAYFDPASGRFSERVERLVKKDGELERALRDQLSGEGSALSRTLASHTGPDSPLMQLIDPKAEKGLAQALSRNVEATAVAERERLLKEFSLDNADGALSRMVRELTERHGAAGEALQRQIAEAVSEFSLDRDDSALSRLVARVDRAQKLITDEFSLDRDGSALARIRKEMLEQIAALSKAQTAFQGEVIERLAEMAARKAEALRSTAHGDDFESALYGQVAAIASAAGDVPSAVGASTGVIRNCKKGDMLVEIGPEHAAAGARIVIEAKQNASYTLEKARAEIEEARKNRSAEIGVFVFSRRAAPAGVEPVARLGQDIFVLWDADDEASDFVLRAGLSLAKGLAARAEGARAAIEEDVEAVDRAIREIEKQAGHLDDIFKWAQTTKSSGEKIEDRARRMKAALEKQIAALEEGMAALRKM